MGYQRVLAMKLWAWTRSPGERRGLGAEPDEPFLFKGLARGGYTHTEAKERPRNVRGMVPEGCCASQSLYLSTVLFLFIRFIPILLFVCLCSYNVHRFVE